MEAGYHYTLGNLGWRYTPTSKLLFVNHAAWMREKYDNTNPSGVALAGGFYGEWVWNTAATWMWTSRGALDAGWSLRRIRQQGFWRQFDSSVLRVHDRFDGTAERTGGYLQQSYAGWSGRLRLSGGVRWDYHSLDRLAATSPSGSATLKLTASTQAQFGFGQYVQYPELSVLGSILGSRWLPPMRSNQTIAAIEQRLGERTRLRAEYYNRDDRDLPYQPFFDPRVVNGKIFTPPPNPLYASSLRGYARGVEFFVQRSTANGFTGWISYAFGRTGMRDGVSQAHFVSDYDQRHTVNVYAGYRLRSSVNLSLRSNFGSGFPIPGFLRAAGGSYYLADTRNAARLTAYFRTDFRVNRAWTRDKWKLTLYGEIVNLTNRSNYVFESLDSFNARTGQAFVTVDSMFPILPSAGLVFER